MKLNPQNLKPCTPENARERQLLGAKKRHENKVERDLIYKLFQKRLMGKKTVNENDLIELGDDSEGYEIGKKAIRALLDLDIMREKAKKTGNVRGYIELLKAAGVHFDQSKEALGGEENPINVNNRIGPPSDEYRAEMRRQAVALGVFDENDGKDKEG